MFIRKEREETKNNHDNSDYNYKAAAEEGKIMGIQASGMQPIREHWKSPSDLGYSAENTKKILNYREAIKKNIESLPVASVLEDYKKTHYAHIRAAADTDTASPSGSLMYHGGEVLSGITSNVLGGSVATKLFGRASEYYNNPIGNKGRNNRDKLTNTLNYTGGLMLKSSPNVACKKTGLIIAVLGKALQSTNHAAEREHYKLKKQNDILSCIPCHSNKKSLINE